MPDLGTGACFAEFVAPLGMRRRLLTRIHNDSNPGLNGRVQSVVI